MYSPHVVEGDRTESHLAVMQIMRKQTKQDIKHVAMPELIQYQYSSGILRYVYRDSTPHLPLRSTICE